MFLAAPRKQHIHREWKYTLLTCFSNASHRIKNTLMKYNKITLAKICSEHGSHRSLFAGEWHSHRYWASWS